MKEIKEFLEALKQKHFYLVLEDGNLFLEGDQKKLTERELEEVQTNTEIISFIRNNKTSITEYLLANQGNRNLKEDNVTAIYRLSPLQTGMLFHTLYDQTGAYVEQLTCELAEVQIESFKRGWNYLLAKHTILRSSFHADEFDIPVQCVHADAQMPVEVIDYSELGDVLQHSALSNYRKADRTRGFDLKASPLMRITLIRLKDDRYWMLWSFHHMLLDGWSIPLVIEKFLKAYAGQIQGKSLPETNVDQFEDYIRYIDSRDREKERIFWTTYMEGVDNVTQLPFLKTSIDRNKGLGTFLDKVIFIERKATQRIGEFAQLHRITLSTLLQGVWSFILHRYTGKKDVVFGITVSGRPDELIGIEDRIGMYINTLPFHSSYVGNRSIGEWLTSIQHDQMQCREYQYSALFDIQKWSKVQGDLFDTLFIFENYPPGAGVSASNGLITIEHVNVHEQTNYPLTITVASAEKTSIALSYNSDLIDAFYMEQIKMQFEHVLMQLVMGEVEYVKDIQLQKEQEVVAKEEPVSVEVPLHYQGGRTIVQLFEEQVMRTPDLIAVTYNDEELAYRELDQRSNQMANWLNGIGIVAGSLVPICFEKGTCLIVSILAILKTGSAYVPMDPEYPIERIESILRDTNAKIVLTDHNFKVPILDGIAAIFFDVSASAGAIQKEGVQYSSDSVVPDGLAYIIYTSGSSGQPKGVMVEHRSIINLIGHQVAFYAMRSDERILQFSNACFDASVEQIFLAITTGSTLVLLPKEIQLDMKLFDGFIADQQITHLDVTPSYLTHITCEPRSRLRRVVCGGEICDVQLALQWSKLTDFYNVYGPTEATITSVVYKVNPETDFNRTHLPIGKPVSNTITYLLDEDGHSLPIGAVGDLFIGGSCLARGYLNQPELTRERFIPNPFSTNQEDRLYRTGDLCRQTQEGYLEYIGRADHQVKIRGYRVELEEIKIILEQHAEVQSAAVIARADGNKFMRIISYIIPRPGIQLELLKSYLAIKLPHYMHPSSYVFLEEFPLTLSGKLDYRSLPQPEASLEGYVAPTTDLQTRLTEIWADVLKIPLENVGIHSNFFDLGGHSISLMMLTKKINQHLNLMVSVAMMFRLPTIADLEGFILNGDQGIETTANALTKTLDDARDNLNLLNELMSQS